MTEIEDIYIFLRNFQFNKAVIYNKCHINMRGCVINFGYRMSFFTEKLLRPVNVFWYTEKVVTMRITQI